ncbi:MAG: 50S ribosomal protein L15 [Patescibacteria group bacterium]
MSLSLNTIKPGKHSKKDPKRVGRGLGSKGTYSGRGVKGQGARSGISGLKLKGFRKILLSTPKNRGFKSLNKKPQIVQVGDLANIFVDGSKVNPKQLFKKQLIASETADVKILSLGEISVKIIVEGCKVSATAKEKIEKAGGSVV